MAAEHQVFNGRLVILEFDLARASSFTHVFLLATDQIVSHSLEDGWASHDDGVQS